MTLDDVGARAVEDPWTPLPTLIRPRTVAFEAVCATRTIVCRNYVFQNHLARLLSYLLSGLYVSQ